MSTINDINSMTFNEANTPEENNKFMKLMHDEKSQISKERFETTFSHYGLSDDMNKEVIDSLYNGISVGDIKIALRADTKDPAVFSTLANSINDIGDDIEDNPGFDIMKDLVSKVNKSTTHLDVMEWSEVIETAMETQFQED